VENNINFETADVIGAGKKNKRKTEIKLVKRHAPKEHRFKSVDVFLIKKNAEEIAELIEKHGHLLPAEDPAVAYIQKEIYRLREKIFNISEFTPVDKKEICHGQKRN
jgi:hypothetical protein